jgi:hypothetical protein
MYSIIPILFYQGLEKWDPESELKEIKALNNPILSGQREEFLIFNLQRINPERDFVSPELRAGLLLLKITRYRWEEFIEGWRKIREILNSMEEAKRIDLEEEMLDYIFRSRTVVRQAHQPNWIVIYLFYRITEGSNYGKESINSLRKSFRRR